MIYINTDDYIEKMYPKHYMVSDKTMLHYGSCNLQPMYEYNNKYYLKTEVEFKLLNYLVNNDIDATEETLDYYIFDYIDKFLEDTKDNLNEQKLKYHKIF